MSKRTVLIKCKCEECGKSFERKKWRVHSKTFCSRECRTTFSKSKPLGDVSGRFKKGQRASPSTEIKRGQRIGIATEFKAGAPRKVLPLGSVSIRTCHATKVRRAWVKVAEPNKWRQRAIVAWEISNGPLPKGMIVHHKDRDTLNDSPENLEAKTTAAHMEEHRDELLAGRSMPLKRKR